MSHDDIYAMPQQTVAPFQFGSDVVAVFPDMIERSVPGYTQTLSTLRSLAARLCQPGSTVYDLGCSLGAASLAVCEGLGEDGDVRIMAVDSSEAMVAGLRERLDALNEPPPITVEHADVRDVEIRNASLVILNYTMQFIDPGYRRDLLKRVHDGLRPGGMLLLSEKIRFPDHRLNELNISLHHEFKRQNGYSDMEISQKRNALENVLIPDTLEQHRARLNAVGFTSADVWYQCFNFASIMAFK